MWLALSSYTDKIAVVKFDSPRCSVSCLTLKQHAYLMAGRAHQIDRYLFLDLAADGIGAEGKAL